MLDLEETCEELIITQMINNFVNKLLSILKTISVRSKYCMINNKYWVRKYAKYHISSCMMRLSYVIVEESQLFRLKLSG